mgnify:FL=1
MKVIRLILFVSLISWIASACNHEGSSLVRIETPYGSMVVRLYDDTPIHRDNFLKLVRNHDYDSLLFHRVIQGFMIQGGDTDSRNASIPQQLGGNQIGGDIEAEIVHPAHFHKKGALAAARKPDHVNPDKKSSGSQFYIVQGGILTDSILGELETRINNTLRQEIFYKIQPQYADSLKYYQSQGMQNELMELQIKIIEKVEETLSEMGEFHYTDEQRLVYTTIGGTPHLDGNYTIFGEVIEGLDVIDKIAEQPVYKPADRPATDIWMTMQIIE